MPPTDDDRYYVPFTDTVSIAAAVDLAKQNSGPTSSAPTAPGW